MDVRVLKSPARAVQRGLTMIIALVVVAVLLFVAVVLLSNAFGSVATENSIRAKIAAFDAAEAGIDQVVEVLDDNHGDSSDCILTGQGNTAGTLADGGTYSWCIEYNGVKAGHGGKVKDHEDGKTDIVVPANTVYAWSLGSAQNGGRGVLIEAFIAPSSGFPLPDGAVDAAGNVYSRADVGIYESSPGAADAAIRSNGNIYQTTQPFIVQGNTYAVGSDQITGANGTVNSGSPAMTFPTAQQIAAATQNARREASSAAAVISPPTDSIVLTGDVYIDGGIDLTKGTVVFQHAKSVFINGNLCVRGPSAHIINDGATIWVNGVVSTAGTGRGYAVAPGSTGYLVALGTDGGTPCNSTENYAVILDASATQHLGFVYAPMGSIDLTGVGTQVGAIDAGGNIYLDSSHGGGLRYDPGAIAAVPTYDFKIVSYMEY